MAVIRTVQMVRFVTVILLLLHDVPTIRNMLVSYKFLIIGVRVVRFSPMIFIGVHKSFGSSLQVLDCQYRNYPKYATFPQQLEDNISKGLEPFQAMVDYLHNWDVQIANNYLAFLHLYYLNIPIFYKRDILYILQLGTTQHLMKWINNFVIIIKYKDIFDHVWIHSTSYPDFISPTKLYSSVS